MRPGERAPSDRMLPNITGGPGGGLSSLTITPAGRGGAGGKRDLIRVVSASVGSLTWVNANFSFLRCAAPSSRQYRVRTRDNSVGTVVIHCPKTQKCISTGMRLDRVAFGSMPVFFSAPTVHHVVPCTTGLPGTHGSAITAPTTAIQTARGGSCYGEYRWQHISMDSGPSGPHFANSR